MTSIEPGPEKHGFDVGHPFFTIPFYLRHPLPTTRAELLHESFLTAYRPPRKPLPHKICEFEGQM